VLTKTKPKAKKQENCHRQTVIEKIRRKKNYFFLLLSLVEASILVKPCEEDEKHEGDVFVLAKTRRSSVNAK